MQKIYSGYHALKKLKSILLKLKVKNVLLVTGKSSFSFCGAEKLIDKLLFGFKVVRFYDFEINVKTQDIKKGLRLIKDFNPEVVIGIGGGTVLDMAKSISILADQKTEIIKLLDGEFKSDKKIKTIMVPTTAGSGSESTHFAVVYFGKQKKSLSHPAMLPDYVILDHYLTMNLPPNISAYTGMDALCQGIESFWSVNSTIESRNYSKKSIKMILNDIEKAVRFPNKLNKKNMLLGSNYAGRAINIARTTAAHSVSYPLTSYFKVPHGQAVALTLPSFLEFNFLVDQNNIQDRRGVQFVKQRLKELLKIMKCKTSAEAKLKLENIMETINIKTRLSDYGIKKNQLIVILKNGFSSTRMMNNPVKVTQRELKNILLQVY